MFDEYMDRWHLTPDGAPIITHSSRLLPVLDDNTPAMLKIAVENEEKFGAELMVWWNGDGAARVLRHDGAALLLERAGGDRSLAEMALGGPEGDDDATRLLCRAVARLHAPRPHPAPKLIPLTDWFRDLPPAAATQGGILALSAATARELLQNPRGTGVLHGDIHHGNVLDFGDRGWLAIDPKRLGGEQGFDYANIFCNPDSRTATLPGRLARQVHIVTEETGIERKRLLQWILAWAGLSAAWGLADGMEAEKTLLVAEMASQELGHP